MASLNLSINGPSIKSSYNGVVNGPLPSSGSPTHAQWALFSVQAPLMNAFQDSGSKESILKVESTGDGELADLIEDFNEGRIQFAFVKVKDLNTALPKNVLIAWCGGGVPERTKGYFTSHTAAVAKVLHGYHVQITARSDSDLEPETIMQKVSDASGAKYSAGSSDGVIRAAPPPVKSKPVFTPTSSSAGRAFDPLIAARSRRDDAVDNDGWGNDAPPVTRTQLEKVESAYRPTKVNMAELTRQKAEPSRFDAGSRSADGAGDVVRGGYQPVGKVDIAAIRAAAKEKGDERPAPVKGAYEPIGKVDIAAIKARAQKPAQAGEDEEYQTPKPVAERTAVFSQSTSNQSERITSMPKPKIGNKFGGASTFTGTKAPTPGGLGFGASPAPTVPPVTATSRTFADQGGKTPAQLWAEKKARERGESVGSTSPAGAAAAPVVAQRSGAEGWKSGYAGKSWAVQAPGYSRDSPADAQSQQNTGDAPRGATAARDDGGVASVSDRLKDASLIGSAPSPPAGYRREDDLPSAPPVPDNSRPSGGFALPGLPSRPPPTDVEAEEEEEQEEEPHSPIRVAAPVARAPEPESEPEPAYEPEPEPQPEPARRNLPPPPPPAQEPEPPAPAAQAPEHEPEHEPEHDEHGAAEGHQAVVLYDYEKAEGNEIDLVEGQYVMNIDMVDEDWWMGTNHLGETGLFPSNYVEVVQEEPSSAAPPPSEPAPRSVPSAPAPAAPAVAGPTATALYDYEAAEDNELSFPEDATITNLEFPDEDWWFGHYDGQVGLFPSNYVQLDA
ncbi:hypothetical protein E4U09_000095 [Claviceps aff. purpurea]|uniref:ABP1-actin-binding protein n=1 Tax=Claviceps aff. purpurea TaxID=1967640 RepID=A0A9P7QTG7_9HYPO|nr:hypothetical protein E4U09_000095 [Claviceps aff. purpurea]